MVGDRETDMWCYLSDHLVVLLLMGLLLLQRVAEAYVINAVVEKPKVITCWTCPNKTDNSECNKWAPKKGCPDNYTVCQTIHQIDVRKGQSILVKKRCALPSECSLDMIGCHDTHIPGIQDCISCCSHAYCNDLVPTNLTTALLYSSITNNMATSSSKNRPSLLLTAVLYSIFSLRTSCL